MPLNKLLFYIHSLGGGGAERVVALLASGFARRGMETMVAIEAEADENVVFLDPAVRIERLGTSHANATLKLARLISAQRPDVSVSALGVRNLKHVLASTLAGRRRRSILTYHGHFDAESRFLDRFANRLTPLTTRLAARTVCVSESMRRHVVDDLRGDAYRTVMIHNPVWIEGARPAVNASDLAGRAPTILAIGRLVPEKDFAMLMAAFADINLSEARLVILGEGPQRTALEEQARKIGISDRVSMPGYVAQPWKYFRQARVCAISSRLEAFSNVAVEALAHGLPVISTDCGGPREIISRSEEGSLVPVANGPAMTVALEAALRSPGDPLPRIARAQAFSPDHAIDVYQRLFEEVAEEANSLTRRR
jgi:glycosyltransferase involved in cell wall biosynthesis